MADVARASLPVALVLLIFAAAARAVVWSRIDDADAQRIARQYAEPLATWCLVAVATHALALGASGDADLLSLALPLGVGAAAVLLRPTGEAERPAVAARKDDPAAPVTTAPAPGGPVAGPRPCRLPLGRAARRRPDAARAAVEPLT